MPHCQQQWGLAQIFQLQQPRACLGLSLPCAQHTHPPQEFILLIWWGLSDTADGSWCSALISALTLPAPAPREDVVGFQNVGCFSLHAQPGFKWRCWSSRNGLFSFSTPALGWVTGAGQLAQASLVHHRLLQQGKVKPYPVVTLWPCTTSSGHLQPLCAPLEVLLSACTGEREFLFQEPLRQHKEMFYARSQQGVQVCLLTTCEG